MRDSYLVISCPSLLGSGIELLPVIRLYASNFDEIPSPLDCRSLHHVPPVLCNTIERPLI